MEGVPRICNTQHLVSMTSDDARDSNLVLLRLQQDRLAARPGRIDLQDCFIVAEVQFMVVHRFNDIDHGLAMVKRYQTREERNITRIVGQGRKEWVDLISVVRILGICMNSASGNLKKIVLDREVGGESIA
jgi:hypothetical protein